MIYDTTRLTNITKVTFTTANTTYISPPTSTPNAELGRGSELEQELKLESELQLQLQLKLLQQHHQPRLPP